MMTTSIDLFNDPNNVFRRQVATDNNDERVLVQKEAEKYLQRRQAILHSQNHERFNSSSQTQQQQQQQQQPKAFHESFVLGCDYDEDNNGKNKNNIRSFDSKNHKSYNNIDQFAALDVSIQDVFGSSIADMDIWGMMTTQHGETNPEEQANKTTVEETKKAELQQQEADTSSKEQGRSRNKRSCSKKPRSHRQEPTPAENDEEEGFILSIDSSTMLDLRLADPKPFPADKFRKEKIDKLMTGLKQEVVHQSPRKHGRRTLSKRSGRSTDHLVEESIMTTNELKAAAEEATSSRRANRTVVPVTLLKKIGDETSSRRGNRTVTAGQETSSRRAARTCLIPAKHSEDDTRRTRNRSKSRDRTSSEENSGPSERSRSASRQRQRSQSPTHLIRSRSRSPSALRQKRSVSPSQRGRRTRSSSRTRSTSPSTRRTRSGSRQRTRSTSPSSSKIQDQNEESGDCIKSPLRRGRRKSSRPAKAKDSLHLPQFHDSTLSEASPTSVAEINEGKKTSSSKIIMIPKQGTSHKASYLNRRDSKYQRGNATQQSKDRRVNVLDSLDQFLKTKIEDSNNDNSIRSGMQGTEPWSPGVHRQRPRLTLSSRRSSVAVANHCNEDISVSSDKGRQPLRRTTSMVTPSNTLNTLDVHFGKIMKLSKSRDEVDDEEQSEHKSTSSAPLMNTKKERRRNRDPKLLRSSQVL
jgi:hypothetical protein